MLRTLLLILMAPALVVAASQGGTSSASAGSSVLATVTIPTTVLAGGKPLARGTYQIRLAPPPAESEAQRRVEFVTNGTVVAQELAEVLRDEDLPVIGDSARPAAQGVRVETLKGGEFVRISIKRDTVRYLIHLPVSGAART